jgi:hypothetical protein
MSIPAHQVLEAARTQAGMSVDELWMAYFALGGAALPATLRLYLAGDGTNGMDYDVVAQAINERFLEKGGDHPVPYRDELT